jgi:hypothetical protein
MKNLIPYNLFEMSKYDDTYINDKILDIIKIFKEDRGLGKIERKIGISNALTYCFDGVDVEQLKHMHSSFADIITIDYDNHNFKGTTTALCFHTNCYFYFQTQVEDNYGDVEYTEKSKVIPINTDTEKIIEDFYKFVKSNVKS